MRQRGWKRKQPPEERFNKDALRRISTTLDTISNKRLNWLRHHPFYKGFGSMDSQKESRIR